MQDSLKKRFEETFDKLEKNPLLINIGKYGLEEFKKDGYLDEKHIKTWEVLLDLPVKDIRSLVMSETEIGEHLRKTFVFTKLMS